MLLRRSSLAAFVAFATLPCFALACSSGDPPASTGSTTGAGTGGGSAVLPGPEEWNRPVTPPTDAEAATKRTACGYTAGALPAETQGESTPQGADIPIDHIVVVMMENRSFDHYFQKLPEYGQPDVDVAPAGFTNPDPDGQPIAPFHDTQYCFVDTNHSWNGTHTQLNGGAMDGFVKTNEGWHEVPAHGTLDMIKGTRAMGHYDQTDLPFYYWLASEFAIADRYFSALPGPTYPNRMFLYAANSFGLTYNTIVSEKTTLFDYMELRKVDWKVYADGTPGFAGFVDEYLKYKDDHLRSIDDYLADAAAGKLPAVAFVDPNLARPGPAENDEHPPNITQLGQAFTAKVINALSTSPNWKRSALFLTYDEHGGLFDHVVPPKACPPDDTPPEFKDGTGEGAFDQYGVRVPMIVVSPFAKKHYVGHKTYDHTSILRFIAARHVIPALSNRDANAEAPWDMFDFTAPPHLDPPAITLPPVNQAAVDACVSIYEE